MSLIAVAGLGNLGLPLAELLKDAGHIVVGVDPSPQARCLAAAVDVLAYDPESDADRAMSHLRFDVGFVIVPTPSRADGTYDPSMVMEAATSSLAFCRVVAVISTLLPAQLEQVADVVGFHRLVYCPEFVRLGFVHEDMHDPDFVLLGADDDAPAKEVEDLWRSIQTTRERPYVHLTLAEAAIAKVALNCFVTTKISYANMLAEICGPLGADAEKVCEAIGHDRRIGHDYLRPGGAYRGPCFPRDNRALSALADSVGVEADIADATDRINLRQEHYFPEMGDRGY